MPIPPCSSDQPAAVCCDRLFTVTQQAALIAGLAVRNCFGDICSEMPIYVSHGEPVGGGDYVAAWLASITTPAVVESARTFFVKSRVNINVVVCLSGFPRIRVQGGDIAPSPSPDEHTNAAYYSYGAMETVYRAVISQLLATPGAQLGGCDVAGFSQLVPHDPAAGNVRWSMGIFVDYRP
jgi:hypothetical protein